MKNLLILAAVCSAMSLNAQSFKGNIVNQEQEPVFGAFVSFGSFGNAISDTKGQFEIPGLTEGKEFELVITHVGYETLKEQLVYESGTEEVVFVLTSRTYALSGFEVSAMRANERTPFAESTVSREKIERLDVSVDMPYLMDLEPSVVVTSDAGTGIGYTGMRVRGSDPQRVNVTINGVALNDAESSTVFWVNIPDLAASTEDIQIQRGVGTSTNGPGAFGASVNVKTGVIEKEAYARASAFGGSFNTRKFNVAAGSGLLNDKFTLDVRLSDIKSDGFIDRGSADLSGYYLQGAWVGKNSSLRLIGFGGNEVTYQAWYGVPGEIIDTNRTYNFYTYENEVDNYGQQHFQALFDHSFNEQTKFNLTLFRTYGAGYFEQFREQDELADYFIAPVVIGNDTVTTSDIIRRRWLDNTLTGANASVQKWFAQKHNLIVGAGYSHYQGAHFGEVIWAQFAGTSSIRDRYYDNDATKTDANIFAKYTHAISSKADLFGDLQYRTVSYDFLGIDENAAALDQSVQLGFFNPKAGVVFRPKAGWRTFASVAVGNKEPNRNDFTESAPDNQPVSEQLVDYEFGAEMRTAKRAIGVNVYYMDYTNQLVLTGELNDVGSPKRINVPESYRAGVELAWGMAFGERLKWNANAAFSQNKIVDFTEFVDDYDANFNWIGQREINYEKTDLAFSPNVVGSSELEFTLHEKVQKSKAEVALITKYVGKQFIDNSGNDGVALDPWFVNDLRMSWQIMSLKGFKEISLMLVARNILDEEYESNGWSYPFYVDGDRTQSIGLYPQAGRNFLGGITMKF